VSFPDQELGDQTKEIASRLLVRVSAGFSTIYTSYMVEDTQRHVLCNVFSVPRQRSMFVFLWTRAEKRNGSTRIPGHAFLA
jgi:hypothetical protein